MSDIKITFDEELTHEGITFEKKAAYGSPKIGQYYLNDEAEIRISRIQLSNCKYVILTPKKKKYTLIKVEGVLHPSAICLNVDSFSNQFRVVSNQVVEE